MRKILISVSKEETETRKTQVVFLRKTPLQKNQKVGKFLSVEEGIWKFRVCMVLNHKSVIKCVSCDT